MVDILREIDELMFQLGQKRGGNTDNCEWLLSDYSHMKLIRELKCYCLDYRYQDNKMYGIPLTIVHSSAVIKALYAEHKGTLLVSGSEVHMVSLGYRRCDGRMVYLDSKINTGTR